MAARKESPMDFYLGTERAPSMGYHLDLQSECSKAAQRVHLSVKSLVAETALRWAEVTVAMMDSQRALMKVEKKVLWTALR